MSRLLKRFFSPFYNALNWLRINAAYLQGWRESRPPRNGRPTVLMVPAEPMHPFYETWRQGVEANGWNLCWLQRGSEVQVAHQMFLYLALCLSAQVVHLIDLDLQTLFGEHNAISRVMSFITLRIIALWPRLLGKRVVYSFGNFVPHEYDTPAERQRHQLICSLVQDIISVAPSMTEALKSSGIPASRIWPVEHADIAEFFQVPDVWPDFRQHYGIPKHAIVVLYTGSIRPYKGIEVAIEAFKRSTDSSLRLVIAGNPAAGYTAERVARLVEGDTRIILGPLRKLSNEEMGWMFQAADYCVLPYRDVGHSGLVCQSLGLGVPVIGSRVGCLPDYLGTGAGILFAPGDVEELAGIFDNLRSFDHAKARAVGLAIMRQRTPEQIGQRLVRVYEYRHGGPVPGSDWLF